MSSLLARVTDAAVAFIEAVAGRVLPPVLDAVGTATAILVVAWVEAEDGGETSDL